jgi:hypothetical protein
VSDIRPDIWRLQSKADAKGLIAALRDEMPDIRKRAAAALRALGAAEAIPHLRALLTTERDPTVREALLASLAVLEPGNETLELDALEDERDSLLDHLIAALQDPDTDQVISAARVLGEMRNKRAVEPLVVVFNEKTRPTPARLAAAEALLALESAPVEVALLKALRSDKWRVRRNGAAILGQVRATWAVEPLSLALRDPDENVRRTALAALKRIDTPESRAVLDKLRTRELPSVSSRETRASRPATASLSRTSGAATTAASTPPDAPPSPTKPLASTITPTHPTRPDDTALAARDMRRRAVEDTQISTGRRTNPVDPSRGARPARDGDGTGASPGGDPNPPTQPNRFAWPKREEAILPKTMLATKPLDPKRLEESQRRMNASASDGDRDENDQG